MIRFNRPVFRVNGASLYNGQKISLHALARNIRALGTVFPGYLIYLAWQAFRSSAAKISTGSSHKIRIPRLYRRGIIMNVTNPKVSIFFLAFLPQFADPERGPLKLQIMILGGLFIVSTLIVFGGISFVAGSLGEWLNRSQKIQRIMNWMAGIRPE